MGYSQHLDILTSNRIHDGVGEALHHMPTLSVKPRCTEHRVLEQQVHGVLEFGEKCLRQSKAGALSIVFGCFPQVGLGLGMQ